MTRARWPLLALAGVFALLTATDTASGQWREELLLGGYYLGVGYV